MYISEAIRRADALAPNKYTMNEKYAWCDELGAMLYQEYLKRYKKVVIEPDESGEYLLPEGITFEMVDKIIAQGREIEKYDFRSFGIRPIYGLRHKCYIPEHCQRQGDIAVIYLEQYQPIRTAEDENLTITTSSGGNYFDFEKIENCPFQEGDALKLSRNVSDADWLNDEVTVTEVDVLLKRVYFSPAAFSDAGQKTECIAKRIVTEETIVPPPYDQMYIDWILAKIAFYQNNFIVYNQQMNKFNQTIGAYHKWLMERRTQNKDNKVTGWW